MKLAAAFLGVMVISGCATIMNEDMVSVPVYTTPAGATVTINGQAYTSPATVQAPRGKGDFKLYIEKEGYQPVTILLTQSADAWLWGNVVFGGLIGVAVDYITGDAYDLDPEVVSADLVGARSAQKTSSGGLQIVLMDINELPASVASELRQKKPINR